MKKILLLLLFTVASYGQAVFDEGIQIKNNTTDNSSTKVNVQSTDGTINTISKADLVNVVEVNDVPSLPLIGEDGKIYVVKNINKIYRWNGTIYQELAINLVTSVAGKVGAVTLVKADVGLANVDNTTDLLKPISTATQTALDLKENAFSKNTAFNKNFGTAVGTVAEGNDSRILNGQTAFGWGNHAGLYSTISGSNINQSSFRTALGLGSNAYSSTAYLPLSGGTLTGEVVSNLASNSSNLNLTKTDGFGSNLSLKNTSSLYNGFIRFLKGDNSILMQIDQLSNGIKIGGASFFNDDKILFSSTIQATSFNGSATLTGTPTAPTATAGTNTTQIATTAFVQANAKPYKVYTALVSQTSTSAPVLTVLENTTGATVTASRAGAGAYSLTFSVAVLVSGKTSVLPVQTATSNSTAILFRSSTTVLALSTFISGAGTDASLSNDASTVEVRIYP